MSTKQSEVINPKLYLEVESISSSYTSRPTGILEPSRAISRHSDCWQDPCSSQLKRKPKTLIFTDWTYSSWHPYEKIEFIEKIKQLQEAGFKIYFACGEQEIKPINDLFDKDYLENKIQLHIDRKKIAETLAQEEEVPVSELCFLDYFSTQELILNKEELEFDEYKFRDYDSSKQEQKISQIKQDIKRLRTKPKIVSTMYIDGKIIEKVFGEGETVLDNNVFGIQPIDFASFKLCGKYKNLKILNLTDCKYLSDSIDTLLGDSELEELVELDLSNSNITAANLAKLLAKTPNLKKLKLQGCQGLSDDIEDLLQVVNLDALEELDLSNNITVANLAKILAKTPNLERLNLILYKGLADDIADLLRDSKLEALVELDLSTSNITAANLAKLLAKTPKLKQLKLCSYNKLFDDIGDLLQGVNLDALEELYLFNSNITVANLAKLLAKTPKLKQLKLQHYQGLSDDIRDLLQGVNLNALEELGLSYSNITAANLTKILAKIPNLKQLKLDGCNKLFDDIEDLLKGVNLNALVKLDLYDSNITVANLAKILAKTPNLKKLNLQDCKSITKEQIKEIKSTYPNIDIILDEAPALQAPTYRYLGQNLNFDADTSETGSSNLFNVTQYFYGNPALPVNSYRLNVSNTLQLDPTNREHPFQLTNVYGSQDALVTCSEAALSDIVNNAYLWPIEQSKLSYKDFNTYYCNYPMLLTNEWQQLPSLSAGEIFIACKKIDGIDIELAYYHGNNMHYVRRKPSTSSVSPDGGGSGAGGGAVMGESVADIPVHINLEFQVAVPKQQPKLEDKIIKDLVEKYRGFGSGALEGVADNATGEDLINAIIEQQKGACRHRAVAFKYEFDKLKDEGKISVEYQARVITSDCHAFVEVSQTNTGQLPVWITCDLGGYPAELKIKSTLPDKKDQEPVIAELSERPYTSENYDHYFKTWTSDDTDELDDADVKSYVQKIIATTVGSEASADKGKNKLILTSTDEDARTLSLALQQVAKDTSRPVFYINSPDDLVCSAPWLARKDDDGTTIGEIKTGPGGSLHQFLIDNKDNAPVIVVNYCNFKPQDLVRLNSLIDETRVADGTFVPNKAAVIGVYNKYKPDAYTGADFYSRFSTGGVESCPLSKDKLDKYRLGNHSVLESLDEEAELKEEDDDYVINLHGSALWQNILLGRWELSDKGLEFKPGELEKAIASGKRIVLLNPPNSKEFTRFWEQAFVQGNIDVFGKIIEIKSELKEKIVTLDRYDLFLYNSRFELEDGSGSAANPMPEFVLNPSTFASFCAGFVINNDDASLVTTPGIIEQHENKTLKIYLTRQINTADWSLLLDLCKKHKVKLRVIKDKDVALPDGIDITRIKEREVEVLDFSIDSDSIKDDVEGEGEALEDSVDAVSTSIPRGIMLIESSDVSASAILLLDKYKKAKVIDVSSFGVSDLFISTSGKFNQEELKFEFWQKLCAVVDLLNKDETVILKGDFSSELRDEIAKFAGATKKDRLIIVSNGSGGSVGHYLKSSDFGAYAVYKHNVTIDDKATALAKIFGDDNIALFTSSTDEQKAGISFDKWYTILSSYLRSGVDAGLSGDSTHTTSRPMPAPAVSTIASNPGAGAGSAAGGIAATDVPEEDKRAVDRRYVDRLMQQSWQGLESVPDDACIVDTELSAADFNSARLTQVNKALEILPFVFIAGVTGVGKSTFITEVFAKQDNTEVFIGEDKLKAWAENKDDDKQKVLFIDEANITDRDWCEFEGLFATPKHIIIDGEYIELTDKHKVIFAGNPVSYSNERQLPKLFARHGNTVLFKPMPNEYIKTNILLPVFAGLDNLDEINQDYISDICKDILNVYDYICSKSKDKILISARELQMLALLAITTGKSVYDLYKTMVPEELKADFISEFKDKLSKEDESRDRSEESERPDEEKKQEYVWTESRQELKAILQDLLEIRKVRQLHEEEDNPVKLNDTQKHGGLGGLIIEGEPGVGKSAAVIAALLEQGLKSEEDFYVIPVSASPSVKIAKLREAFKKGAIVIMDEINSTIMLERELNAMLMGFDAEGKRPDKPGFMLIGTQNPISMAGRQATSPAILRRTIKYNLPDLSKQEMINIIMGRYDLDEEVANNLVASFIRQRSFAIRNNKSPVPNFRNLLKTAKSIKKHAKLINEVAESGTTEFISKFINLFKELDMNAKKPIYTLLKNKLISEIKTADDLINILDCLNEEQKVDLCKLLLEDKNKLLSMVNNSRDFWNLFIMMGLNDNGNLYEILKSKIPGIVKSGIDLGIILEALYDDRGNINNALSLMSGHSITIESFNDLYGLFIYMPIESFQEVCDSFKDIIVDYINKNIEYFMCHVFANLGIERMRLLSNFFINELSDAINWKLPKIK